LVFVATVLDGNKEAAALLARVVHEEVILDEASIVKILTDSNTKEYDEMANDSVGIWIDPIGMEYRYSSQFDRLVLV